MVEQPDPHIIPLFLDSIFGVGVWGVYVYVHAQTALNLITLHTAVIVLMEFEEGIRKGIENK